MAGLGGAVPKKTRHGGASPPWWRALGYGRNRGETLGRHTGNGSHPGEATGWRGYSRTKRR